MNRLIQSAVLIAAVASAPAWAQSKSEIERMRPYLGVLAPDCSNYMLPQLKNLGDSLVVQDGGKAVLTGLKVKPAPKYFGATPPPEFETAYTSEIAGGEALVFVYYRNASGLFAAVEGGPKVMAALPAAFKGKRARHCDPNRNVAPGQRRPQPAEQRQQARVISEDLQGLRADRTLCGRGFFTTRRQRRSTTRRSARS